MKCISCTLLQTKAAERAAFKEVRAISNSTSKRAVADARQVSLSCCLFAYCKVTQQTVFWSRLHVVRSAKLVERLASMESTGAASVSPLRLVNNLAQL